jgi:hypothetical protein
VVKKLYLIHYPSRLSIILAGTPTAVTLLGILLTTAASTPPFGKKLICNETAYHDKIAYQNKIHAAG